MMRPISAVIGGALLAFASTAASAQSITALAGGYIPAGDLKTVQSGAEDVLDRNGTLALGFNLDFGLLRGTLAYASGTTIRNADKEDIGEGTVLAAAADIVLRPLPRILVQPYLLGGVGFKNLSYDSDNSVTNAFPEDDRELSLHAGIGADVMFGPVGIVAEITDFISKDADDKWGMHDAFLMVGAKLRLGGR